MTLGNVNTHCNLEGRFAIVTGATRGIGHAIAARLVQAGARVLGTGRSARGSVPAGCEYRGVDLADEAACAGFAETSADAFLLLHRVNLLAPMLLCRAVVPAMRAARWGRIVNVASIWSLRSLTGRAAYSASKFGLDGMTAALAAEVAADNVLANCVSPGFIGTEMLRTAVGEDGIRNLVAQVPAGRLGMPQEVAAFVTWLAGPENTYICGPNIVPYIWIRLICKI